MMDMTSTAADYDAPGINKITFRDLKDALAEGYADYTDNRTDVLFLCLIYPLIMYVAVRMAFGYGVLPLIYPVFTGAALLGPVVAVGLYHVSWRREQGLETHWRDAFRVFQHHSIGSIGLMTLILVGLYCAWLMAAITIYEFTLGKGAVWYLSPAEFVREVLTTSQGWTLIVVGNTVGLIFALIALCISMVSFPMLVDKNVGPINAVVTSVRAAFANPGPTLAWGLIVALLLFLGSLPFFLGLAVVMPVLGHATWHLYRKMVRH
ncbi:DUF2189 domain-containing protein [Emcibacter sp. SYSU 3D8]|uniref:DUF2189 domain-containing protein n=1 Tax=Emcibacter sp. SYSU 3D8 TaxID=3133969 RepID=UPI0031FE7E93